MIDCNFVPVNEMGVVWFFANVSMNGRWNLRSINSAYPDAIIERDGTIWRVEFEFYASSFIDHRHDPRLVDLIVCWENDYEDSPIPVIELRNPDWHLVPVEAATEHAKEIEYWRRRALRAEYQIRRIAIPNEPAIRFAGRSPAAPMARERAIQLYQSGHTAADIARTLNAKYTTVQSWLRRASTQTNGVTA